MKKNIILILTINILLWFDLGSIANSANKEAKLSSGYANELTEFNLWLKKNNYNQYLKEDSNGNLVSTLDVKPFENRWSQPYHSNPNRDTLIYYHYKNTWSHTNGDRNTYQFGSYKVEPAKKYEFKFSITKNEFVQKQMQKKALLSYLYVEGDIIKIDEISPASRFGEFVDNDTQLRSNSMGKSIVSYVLGTAICEGYIDGVNSNLNDWPLIQNTLYYDQKIIDLINMAAGDKHIIHDFGLVKDNSYDPDTKSIQKTMNFFFRGSESNEKQVGKKYNYHQLLPNIIFNYVLYKTGDDFQTVLNKTFQKAGIENAVYFSRLKDPTAEGDASNMFFASRYDWLRIAKAMMNDYQNDTCVGKYLKTLHKNKIKKNVKGTDYEEPGFSPGTSYGGYFHMNYPGLKNRVIFGISGYGGNTILMDMENSQIVVINSIHYNNAKYKYNVKKLMIEPFKKRTVK